MYRCSRSRFHGKETFTRLRRERLASYNIWSASRSKAAKNSKQDALKRHGTLNPHPDAVTDPLFETSLSPLQHSASHALPTIKRKPTFSEMASSGYCPRIEDCDKRHKLTPEVLDFAVHLRASDASWRPLDLAAAIRGRVRYKCASTEYRIFRTFSVLPIAPVWIRQCKWDYFLAALAAIRARKFFSC